MSGETKQDVVEAFGACWAAACSAEAERIGLHGGSLRFGVVMLAAALINGDMRLGKTEEEALGDLRSRIHEFLHSDMLPDSIKAKPR